MKKLGDLSSYRSKKLLKCVLRICFHERRLQYMEAEQIKEWSLKHPGERIIDVDLPLSYGVYEPHKDTKNINCLSFKWDPTRGKVEKILKGSLDSIPSPSVKIQIMVR